MHWVFIKTTGEKIRHFPFSQDSHVDVVLYDTNGPEDVNLGQLLVSMGLAKGLPCSQGTPTSSPCSSASHSLEKAAAKEEVKAEGLVACLISISINKLFEPTY